MPELQVLPYVTTFEAPRSALRLRLAVILLGALAILIASSSLRRDVQYFMLMHRYGGLGYYPIGAQLVDVGCCAFTIWWGIGAIRLRRWVRPVYLSAIKPFMFMLAVVDAIHMLPILDQLRSSTNYERYIIISAVADGFAVAVCLTGYILFRSRAMEMMLSNGDSRTYWIHKYTVPVLSIFFSLLIAAAMFISAIGNSSVNPGTAFERFASLAWAACAIISLVLAVGIIFACPWAWPATLFFALLVWGVHLTDVLKMNWSATGLIYLYVCEIGLAGAAIGYLVWAHKFIIKQPLQTLATMERRDV